MSSFATHLRHTIRRLARTPMFSVIALLTLAIGIGANAAIFSVIEGILLKPLPYSNPERLVSVWHSASGINLPEVNMAPSLYFTYREENKTFEDIGIWQYDDATITGLAEPEHVPAIDVTEGLLPVLGVQPYIGRTFTKRDDSAKTPETMMISYGFWQSHFGGSPSAIGRRIMVGGKATEIIGVLPENFRFLDHKVDVLKPFQFNRSELFLGNFSYQGIARLKPGVTIAQANADIGRMIPIAMDRFPAPPGYSKKMFEEIRMLPDVRPLKRDVVGDISRVLWVLMGTVGIVLLIACANVANLLLVRADGRQQELAIRAALGAGFGRLARELLVESVTLGLVGGALGLGLADASLRLLVRIAPENLPRLSEIGIDPLVIVFTFAISLIAGIVFGLIPVFKYAGPRLALALRAGGRTASQSRERHRARNLLVVVQVAMALVLLISSGLMIRTFRALRSVQPGFDTQNLQTLHIAIPEAQVKDAERVVRMDQDILEKIASVPGVQSAALTTVIPMDGLGWNDPVFAQDRTYRENELPPLRHFWFVSPGALKTMGLRLVAGHEITWADTYNRTPVAMVSENMARELWGSPSNALGKRIRETMKSDWREVVGVVSDHRSDGVDKKAPSLVYFPIRMGNFEGDKDSIRRYAAYVIKSDRAGSESFLKELREAVWSVNPNLPLADVRTMDFIYRKSMARTSFTLVMLAIAGGMALLLGVIGIYGVISYSVSQRTREIGIRLALGAQKQELTSMFVRHGLVLACIGAACGLTVAFLLSQLMSKLLFEVSPKDPITYAAVSVGLVAAAVVASYVPARRVVAVDPVEALRTE